MISIVDRKRTKVYYNPEKEVFIKELIPKFKNRLKYFFRLRKYPGKNFEYISKELNKLGIKTPEIIEAEKYRIVTKDIKGKVLKDVIHEKEDLQKKYLDIIVKVLKSGIYFGDMHFGNFIVKDDEIYAIDLEDYRKERFLMRDNKEALRRFATKVDNPEWVEYVKSQVI